MGAHRRTSGLPAAVTRKTSGLLAAVTRRTSALLAAVTPRTSGLLAAVAIVWAGSAGAEPLDLHDPTPRWIRVSFEASPGDQPAQRDAFWGEPLRAWLRPAERPGWVVVAIPPEVVEGQLMVHQDPVPGTFGPMVWVFDARTGHVLSADLEGSVYRRLRLGFLKPRLRAQVRFEMGTERVAGFRSPRQVLGLEVFEHCTAQDDPDCTLVPPAAFDPSTGYVNAVGQVDAEAKGFASTSFSSLGEARFSEDASPVMARRGPTLP